MFSLNDNLMCTHTHQVRNVDLLAPTPKTIKITIFLLFILDPILHSIRALIFMVQKFRKIEDIKRQEPTTTITCSNLILSKTFVELIFKFPILFTLLHWM